MIGGGGGGSEVKGEWEVVLGRGGGGESVNYNIIPPLFKGTFPHNVVSSFLFVRVVEMPDRPIFVLHGQKGNRSTEMERRMHTLL